MKTLIIVLAIGLLAIASFIVVTAIQGEEEIPVETSSASCGCKGQCGSGNSCESSSCSIKTTGSCGCRR